MQFAQHEEKKDEEEEAQREQQEQPEISVESQLWTVNGCEINSWCVCASWITLNITIIITLYVKCDDDAGDNDENRNDKSK